MKSILAILSFVLLVAFTANAQTETDQKKEQTIKTEQTSVDNQSTLSVSEDGKKECEGKSKEECKKQCEKNEKAEYHKNHDEMSNMDCCAKKTEEVLETDGTSEKE